MKMRIEIGDVLKLLNSYKECLLFEYLRTSPKETSAKAI